MNKFSKTLNSDLFHYITGPLLTLLLLFFNFFFFPITLAPAFLILVWATYVGGMVAGMISAGIVAGFAIHQWTVTEPVRMVIVVACSVGVVLLIGELREWARSARELERKAEALKQLNGNIDRLYKDINRLSDLILGWNALSDEAKLERVKEVNNDLATLATLVTGWHRLHQERERVKRDAE